MTADKLRNLYLDFFKKKGHAHISGASLIPENDPTVLFTTAGMHPLVPYLLGEPHPAGKRLVNCQKCIRTGDIDEVGDSSHLTFFEMLGNWSLGDYFKKEAILWSYEFLTSKEEGLGFDPEQLSVTVFDGEPGIPRDEESIEVWKSLGIPEERIYSLPREDNWWGPVGQTGPCGPDTEMFIDTGIPPCGDECRPGCSCGKYFEIWNDVFMQYNRTADGKYEPAPQHNVDTGMGVERTLAMLLGKKTVYDTELFAPLLENIAKMANAPMDASEETTRAYRVIADHVRSSVFILGDQQGIVPGNLGQGYVLRRLIRRCVRFAHALEIESGFMASLAAIVIETYKNAYPELEEHRDHILNELEQEETRFGKTLAQGTAELDKVIANLKKHDQTALSGRVAFRLYDTFGFPIEFTEEICAEQGLTVDREGFEKAFEKHREVSKQGDKSFKGGLADHSDATTALHTATHLLHKALRMVLGEHVEQKGSNITAERLRFDFTHPAKCTKEELAEIENIVNDAIKRDLPLEMKVMTLQEARDAGAIALFAGKYDEQVKVYNAGDFSMEVCGGPHVASTGSLGRFRIKKEGSSSAGVRRIRAVLEPVA